MGRLISSPALISDRQCSPPLPPDTVTIGKTHTLRGVDRPGEFLYPGSNSERQRFWREYAHKPVGTGELDKFFGGEVGKDEQ
jgi:hypothetical protein